MAARISIADLSTATGIAPALLAAEVATIQRESQLSPPTPMERPTPSTRRPSAHAAAGEAPPVMLESARETRALDQVAA
jgi:hypothetical protein